MTKMMNGVNRMICQSQKKGITQKYEKQILP